MDTARTTSTKKKWLTFSAVACVAAALTACDGIDAVEINAPLLDAVGVNLMGKPKPEPNLPERPPLVVPPSANLPEPGAPPTQVASANGQQWPQDPDQMKKEREAAAEAELKERCRTGNWGPNANIDDFRKNTGMEARCRPEWVQNAIKAREEKAR
jgi:hypothetical protein